MTRIIVGLYDELANVRNAIEELVDNGVHRDDISLISSDPDQQYANYLETRNAETDQAAAGAIGGAIGGGLLGLLLGMGALAIPGIGPVIAGGPIMTSLAGAGVGAATGGLIGALVGWGIPANEAEHYAEGVRRGGTLLMVRAADDQIEPVERIMNRHYLVNLEERTEGWHREGWTGFDEKATAPSRVDFASEAATDSFQPQMTTPATVTQADYQNHYQAYYAATGRPYTYYEPAYRFGYTLGMDEQYRGQSWPEIELEARRRWEREYPSLGNWEEFDGAVQYSWDRATRQNQIPVSLPKRF
jgi:uncharacterized membrane protein